MGGRCRLVQFFAAASLAHAAVYYVSSTKGSDSSTGLSPAAPWQSLQRVMRVTLTAGDSVLLRNGDVFVEATVVFLTGMAGTRAAPVTISSYADGDSAADRPLLARPATSAAGPTLTINNSSGVVVAGLEIAGGENGVVFTFDIIGGAEVGQIN